MKYIMTIGLLLSFVCCFVVLDVAAHDPDAHAMADIRNAEKEQDRLQGIINELISGRRVALP